MNITSFILPIILLIFTGWLFKKFNFLNFEIEIYLNKLALNLGLPAIMLLSINQYDVKNILNIKFAVAYIISIVLPFLLAFFIFKFLKNYSNENCIFVAMNASISNSGLISLPIIIGIFGAKGGIPIAEILTISSIFIIPLLILSIEYKSINNKNIVFLNAFKRTALQPFILSTFLGTIINLFSLHIPIVILNYLQYLAALTIPCALIAVGIRLTSYRILSTKAEIIYISLINLFLKPIFAIALGIFLHLSKLYGMTLVIVSSAPVANSIFILAAKYNIYKEESAGIAFLTLILSIFSFPLFLWTASLIWP